MQGENIIVVEYSKSNNVGEKESSSIISIAEAEIFPMKKLMRFINRGCMYLLS